MMLDPARPFGSPYRVANLRWIDGEGVRRDARAPGSDISDLPDDVRAKIEAEWTPEVLAAYAEFDKPQSREPEAPPPPDPVAVKIAALEAMTVLLRTRLDKIDGGGALTTRR